MGISLGSIQYTVGSIAEQRLSWLSSGGGRDFGKRRESIPGASDRDVLSRTVAASLPRHPGPWRYEDDVR
jgi:hypothetical protein